MQAALAKQLSWQDPIRPLQESFHAKQIDVEVAKTHDQGRHLIALRCVPPSKPTSECSWSGRDTRTAAWHLIANGWHAGFDAAQTVRGR